MAEQDAQDIASMNSVGSDIPVMSATPKKSYLIWIVLACVVVGVGLGVYVYQQSLAPASKVSPTPKATTTASQKPAVVSSPIASPLAPGINAVEAQPKTISFPKAGKIRLYYSIGGWSALGVILTDSAGTHEFTIPAGDPGTAMKILDTGYALTGPTTVTMNSYLGTDKTKLSLGWATPAANKCGFNGFGVVDIAGLVSYATAQANGEPLVSTQCWGDYSPNPADTSSKDFNDYTVIVSYTPPNGASPSPSGSAAASASPTATPTPSPSPSPSNTAGTTVTPTPSPRAAMPDTSDGVPVTGVFEVTAGTVSVGLILLVLGLLGLLAL